MMRGLGYGYDMMGGGWVGGILILFFGLLVIAGIVLVVMWAIRSSSGHGHQGTGSVPPGAAAHDEAVAIAKRRFASGEVTREQYDEIMRGLSG
jgi:uncharacterized membrane protein